MIPMHHKHKLFPSQCTDTKIQHSPHAYSELAQSGTPFPLQAFELDEVEANGLHSQRSLCLAVMPHHSFAAHLLWCLQHACGVWGVIMHAYS